MSLCPSDASSDTNTYFCHLSHDSSRTARYLDADNSLSPFSSCHSSVTSRMHCYFPCLLLFRIFLFFPSSTEQWPFCAQLCRLHDFGTMWIAYLCVCVHTPAYAMYFIAVNHWLILSSRFFFRSIMADHTRPTRAWSSSSIIHGLFLPSVIRYFYSSVFNPT